jgi:hypothetical protein
MATKLTILIHKIPIQLHLVAESCTVCSSRSRRPVRKIVVHPPTESNICSKGMLFWGGGECLNPVGAEVNSYVIENVTKARHFKDTIPFTSGTGYNN